MPKVMNVPLNRNHKKLFELEAIFGSKWEFIETPLELKIRLWKFLEVMNKIYVFIFLSQVYSTER